MLATKRLKGLFAAVVMTLIGHGFVYAAEPATAELEGQIESINATEKSLLIKGITLYAQPTTIYEDGLQTFDDLQVGQKVAIRFIHRDERHYISEIGLDN